MGNFQIYYRYDAPDDLTEDRFRGWRKCIYIKMDGNYYHLIAYTIGALKRSIKSQISYEGYFYFFDPVYSIFVPIASKRDIISTIYNQYEHYPDFFRQMKPMSREEVERIWREEQQEFFKVDQHEEKIQELKQVELVEKEFYTYFTQDSSESDYNCIHNGYREGIYVRVGTDIFNLVAYSLKKFRQILHQHFSKREYYWSKNPNMLLVRQTSKREIMYLIHKLHSEQKYFSYLKPLEKHEIDCLREQEKSDFFCLD